MSATEAAKRIGISPSKLYQLAAARAISHYRIGGKIVFSDADVDAYLASCRVGAVAPVPAAPRVRVKLRHRKWASTERQHIARLFGPVHGALNRSAVVPFRAAGEIGIAIDPLLDVEWLELAEREID